MKATKALINGPAAGMLAGIAVLMLSGCYGFKFLPHPVGIVSDAEGCPTAVEEREQKNCPPSTGKAATVQSVCVDQGEWVKWSREESGGFEIDFEGESSPMQADCDLTTATNSLKCRVAPEAADGAYKYSIVVQDCDELDPHIIVK